MKEIRQNNSGEFFIIEGKNLKKSTSTHSYYLENQKRRAFEYNEKHPKYAIFPDGHIEQIFHISDFCKKHNLHRQNVNLCLSGKQKSTKGFKFYKE